MDSNAVKAVDETSKYRWFKPLGFDRSLPWTTWETTPWTWSACSFYRALQWSLKRCWIPLWLVSRIQWMQTTCRCSRMLAWMYRSTWNPWSSTILVDHSMISVWWPHSSYWVRVVFFGFRHQRSERNQSVFLLVFGGNSLSAHQNRISRQDIRQKTVKIDWWWCSCSRWELEPWHCGPRAFPFASSSNW